LNYYAGKLEKLKGDTELALFMVKDKYVEFAGSLGYEVKNIKPHSTAVELYNFLISDEH